MQLDGESGARPRPAELCPSRRHEAADLLRSDAALKRETSRMN